MIKPISQNHSISRVIANFFLAQSYAKPQFLFSKLSSKAELSKYQKKGLSSTNTINIASNALQISNNSDNGFIFEEFNAEGQSINILNFVNIANNKSIINLENRAYSNWKTFRSRLNDDVAILAQDFDVFTEAVGLTYVDEFIWDSTDRIDTQAIFNVGSDLITAKFLDAYNGSVIFVSQTNDDSTFEFIEEKIELTFNNQLKRIVINHTYVLKLKDISIYSDETREKYLHYFDKAHQSNKVLLNDILTNNVLQLINI